jgi:hypothetical protein
VIARTTRTAKGRSTINLVVKASRAGAKRVKKPIVATLTVTRRGGAYPELTLTRAMRIG